MLNNNITKIITNILQNILQIRQDPREKLILVADSLADIKVFELIIKECQTQNINVHFIYYQTNLYDPLLSVPNYLGDIVATGVSFTIFNDLDKQPNILERAVSEFIKLVGSVAIANLSDDYDLRQAINDYAVASNLPILEVPSLDMNALSSDIFSEDWQTMKTLGNNIIQQLLPFTSFHLVSPDGTDLHLTVNPKWINEADNIFHTRSWDYSDNPTLPPPAQDNPPGEIFTNIRSAHGTLVLYQFDNDIAKFAFRNKTTYHFEINDLDHLKYVIDTTDPVTFAVKDTFINPESITSTPPLRANIFKSYLLQKQQEDFEWITSYQKHPAAAMHLSEFAIGINSKAQNPDEPTSSGTFVNSTLITEKKLGVWHIAFGNTPCPDEPVYFNHSSAHIDSGLQNPDLKVYGVTPDGIETLLTSTHPLEDTLLNPILNH